MPYSSRAWHKILAIKSTKLTSDEYAGYFGSRIPRLFSKCREKQATDSEFGAAATSRSFKAIS